MLPGSAAALSWAASFGEKFEEIKRTATPAELYRFLWAMPKGGDIHMHMGLSFWASDWYDAAKDRAAGYHVTDSGIVVIPKGDHTVFARTGEFSRYL